jgi:hypothetical protein
MNKSLLSILLIFCCAVPESLSSMQVEAKTKVAELVASRMNATDRKAEVATSHEVQVVLPDDLCPKGLSAALWALITDYAIDMSSEHEAFTYSEIFWNIMRYQIMNDGQVKITGLHGFAPYIYKFKGKALSRIDKKQTLLIPNMHNTAVEVYRSDGVTLVNKFSAVRTVGEPRRIDCYAEVSDVRVAFVVAVPCGLCKTDNDLHHELVLWNYETNKIEHNEKLSYLVRSIIPLSKERLALAVRDQSRIIIKDLNAQKDVALVLTKSFGSDDRLYELESGNIVTLCDIICYGLLSIWDGVTYKQLITIPSCISVMQLPGKLVIKRHDDSVIVLDEKTLKTELIISPRPYNHPNSPRDLIQFDDKSVALCGRFGHSSHYSLYPANTRVDEGLLVAYLNLPTSQKGRREFNDGHTFQILGVQSPYSRGSHSYESGVQIIWYDQEIAMQMRKLDLSIRVKLKEFLQALRERKTNFIAANSGEPFKLEEAELTFLSGFPARIQKNIKSHFSAEIVWCS